MSVRFLILFAFCSFFSWEMNAQNISLYQQFNGRYDFTFVGNTLNLGENNTSQGCAELIAPSSSAVMNLTPSQQLHKAYLYWAGSGAGDTTVQLNGQPISAQRLFNNTLITSGLTYFSAFAEVTSVVAGMGNGTYTLSELDVSAALNSNAGYCTNRTNFAGWTLVIIYTDPTLPINQLNLYDGLQNIPTAIDITLTNLNVVDNVGAKIGFVAWEGDRGLAVNESLRINGTVLSNPPLNPANNAFNGTNSITGSNQLHNMDLDIYSIQNNIQLGDTSALIQLTSGQDVVLMNVILTTFNSQLPDAVLAIDAIEKTCDSRMITVQYTVSNPNATDPLPANTPIAFYAEGILLGQTVTQTILPINGSESGQVTLILPNSITSTFTVVGQVDDTGNGQGVVLELNETNNGASFSDTLIFKPEVADLAPLVSCNLGFTRGIFNFQNYADTAFDASEATFIGYYENFTNADAGINSIANPEDYTAIQTPQTIYFRVENANCYQIGQFELKTKNCPPTIYNYVSANNDGANDFFTIEGLYGIFFQFELEIYNRWGRLIWKGNHSQSPWDGFANQPHTVSNYISPKGTYYYILRLNDPGFPEPYVGWLYFTF